MNIFPLLVSRRLSFRNKHFGKEKKKKKSVQYFRCTFFECSQSRQETWVSVLVFMGRRRKIKSPRQNVSSEKTTKTTRNNSRTHTVSVNPSTFQSLSTRNGRVHGVGSSNPARSTGGSIGGGDHAGHGHFPIFGSLKGDNTITMTLRHTIHKSPSQQPPGAPTFLMSSPPDKVSSMCPIFVAHVLQPVASCCSAAAGFIGRREAARLTCHPKLKCLLHCTADRPTDRPSAQATYFTILNCVTLAALAQTRAIAIHVDAVGVDVCGLLERWDEGREGASDKACALPCGFSVSFFFLTCLLGLTCFALPHAIFGFHSSN